MLRIGVIYSGHDIQPRSLRGLPHLVLLDRCRVTRLLDTSTSDSDSTRVQWVGNLFRLKPQPLDLTKPLDFTKLNLTNVDAFIVEIDTNSNNLCSLLNAAIDARKHLYLPYKAFASLDFNETLNLLDRAEKNGTIILSVTRFLFGNIYQEFRDVLKDGLAFGNVRDALFRIGVGPVVDKQALLRIGLHSLNVLFDIINGAEPPSEISVAVNESDSSHPAIVFTLLWEDMLVATFYLTSNRLWGGNYHKIEVSGRNAFASTDFSKFSATSSENHIASRDSGDDAQSHVIYGPSGKLQTFVNLATEKEEIEEYHRISKRSLWVFERIKHICGEIDRFGGSGIIHRHLGYYSGYETGIH